MHTHDYTSPRFRSTRARLVGLIMLAFAAVAQPAMSQSVSKTSTMASLSVSPISLPYSDVVTLEATIWSATGERPAQGVNFTIATQQINAQPVPLQNMGAGVWKATLSTPLLETTPRGQLKPNGAVQIATASFTGVSPNYSVGNPTVKLLVINK